MTIHPRPVTDTTPAQIAGMHALAQYRAPAMWRDLPPPSQARLDPPYSPEGFRTLERIMARSAQAGPKNPHENLQGSAQSRARGRAERLDRLVAYLAEHGETPLATLHRHLGVSGSVVGRYARTLQDQGRIKRHYIRNQNGNRITVLSLDEGMDL